MKEVFAENWCCLTCGQCKYFQVDADLENKKSICKRIDHKHIKFAKPWFKSYDCGQTWGTPCRDFQPADWCIWLKKHWVSYDDYCQDREPKGTVCFCVDNDFSVRYAVKTEDFVDGKMFDENGNLKWIGKMYYAQRRDKKKFPTGYELVYEERE